MKVRLVEVYGLKELLLRADTKMENEAILKVARDVKRDLNEL